SPFNLRIVLTQTVIVALGAIGMTLIIIGGGIDLSVGATIALTGVVAALAIGAGWPPALAVVAAVLAGGLVGLGNGLLIRGLQGGEGSVFGSVVGALIMAFLRNGCQQMGWPNYIQEIIIGAIIVLAVALDRLRAGWSTP